MNISKKDLHKIAICLSTYNGERYISEQLDSLISQTYSNWHCYIRDDGSKDNSIDVIKCYVAKDSRFSLLQDDLGNLGVIEGYFHIFNKVDEDYIAVCDQDDVWLADKLMRSLEVLRKIEGDKSIPALVHTDSYFVDDKLNMIREKFIGKRGCKKGLNGIIFANSVQGGSVVFNKALNEESKKIKSKLPCDYQMAMIAELTGVRFFIPEQLLKYRQHQNSSIANSNNKNNKKLNNRYLSSTIKISLSNYHHAKNDFTSLSWTNQAKLSMNEYLYLFGDGNKIKKLCILLKNKYSFYRRMDFLYMILLIVKNKDLRFSMGL